MGGGPRVRAKFFVTEIKHVHNSTPGDVFAQITMVPVYGQSNEQWSKHTPQGDIKMSVTNPKAIEAFELGMAYFVDFTPVQNDKVGTPIPD